MIAIKKLLGGGDTAVKEMINNASMLGLDVIELLWIPRNRLPYPNVLDVIGYKFPLISGGTNLYDDVLPSSEWIDGTLKFYPDDSGRCWGYVYDTDENRDLIASSIVNGWFKIVDKKIREEIFKLAVEKGYHTEPYPETKILVKKSVNEKANEEKIKTLMQKEEDLKDRLKFLEEELLKAKGDKATHINRRLRGIKVQQEEESANEEK